MLEAILTRYGALAVFVGVAVEGEVTLILAGVVAHLGYFDLSTAIAAGALGGMAGDSTLYAVGRRGAAVIRGTALYQRAEPTVERLATWLGPREVVASRFVYGTRAASMVFWGVRGLPYGRFLAFDVVGCVLYAIAFASLGYAFSQSAAALVGNVRRVEMWLLGAAVAALGVALARRFVARRMVTASRGS